MAAANAVAEPDTSARPPPDTTMVAGRRSRPSATGPGGHASAAGAGGGVRPAAGHPRRSAVDSGRAWDGGYGSGARAPTRRCGRGAPFVRASAVGMRPRVRGWSLTPARAGWVSTTATRLEAAVAHAMHGAGPGHPVVPRRSGPTRKWSLSVDFRDAGFGPQTVFRVVFPRALRAYARRSRFVKLTTVC